MRRGNRARWRPVSLLVVMLMAMTAVSGSLAQTSPDLTIIKDDKRYALSLNDIESLGLHRVTMQHPEGPEGTFAGVWLNALLETQGLGEARRLRFIAEDGYTTFLSLKERRDKRYLLVTRLDGKPVAQKDLGPYMLIVPDDAEAAAEGTVSVTRWIWAVRDIQAR